MEFSDYIKEPLSEARKIDIETPSKGGTTDGDFLRAIYAEFGDKAYSSKDATGIRNTFGAAAGGHRYRMLSDGYLEKVGSKFKLTSKGEAYVKANPSNGTPVGATDNKSSDDDDLGTAKGVKDITKLKSKRFIVPKVSANSKYLDQMKTILTHMKGFAQGTVKTTYMLAGDPGTGKTSFIKSLSTMSGIPLVIIEAPHITQEHLINIPFLVIDGSKTRSGNLTIDDSQSQMKVVQAESNLVTQLKSKRKRTPDQIQKEINKNKVLRDIYPMLEKRIQKIADSYNAILFLDEFYRTSSVKIRNVLRNILNGKIGNDRIPQGVYIIMATNIDDEGVDDIPLNQDFHVIDYDVSSKEDFMSYMYGRYVDEEIDDGEETEEETEQGGGVTPNTPTGVAIKPEVWNKFMTELTDDDLGYSDQEADVRLSPRRLEQMLIYIDAALPITTIKDAENILAFIKTNLSNYIEEAESKYLLDKFRRITIQLIKETAPKDLVINEQALIDNPAKKSEWRDQLQHEIEMKIKLGDNRKYVPVVSGQPGIGKTTQMVQMSQSLDMGFIHVDVSNLTPEDITGMPIANMGDTITTEFSEPNLYITIMKEYNAQINDYRKEGRKYNMILLFDEMNRASVPVFNSIRKVLLEKEFEHVKLPDDIIVTGAINPTDIGSIEFTSHTRDVLDIIPSAGNFTTTMAYVKSKNELVQISKAMGFDCVGAVTNTMAQLATEFKSTTDAEENLIEDVDVQPFWWDDGGTKFYVSPREMTECIANTVNQIEDAFDDMGWDSEGVFSEEQYEAFIDEAINVMAKSFVTTFNMITLKQDIQGFTKHLALKITGNAKFRKFFEVIRTKKSANQLTLVQILNNANGDIQFLDKGVIGSYIKDFSSTEMIQDISVITDTYFNTLGGKEIIEKCLELHSRITTSLERLGASNNYTDQLNKYIGGKVAALMASDKLDVLEILEDTVLMNRLKKLVKE